VCVCVSTTKLKFRKSRDALSDWQTGDNQSLMVAEFLREQPWHNHLGEGEESYLFLDAASTQHAASHQLVGKVNLQFTVNVNVNSRFI